MKQNKNNNIVKTKFQFSHNCLYFFLFTWYLLVNPYSLQRTTRGLFLVGDCFLRQVLGVMSSSIRIFARNIGDPYMAVIHNDQLSFLLSFCFKRIYKRILGKNILSPTAVLACVVVWLLVFIEKCRFDSLSFLVHLNLCDHTTAVPFIHCWLQHN